jgi:hypothetical protein
MDYDPTHRKSNRAAMLIVATILLVMIWAAFQHKPDYNIKREVQAQVLADSQQELRDAEAKVRRLSHQQ